MKSRRNRFLADENLGVQIPRYLRSIGVDITSIAEISPGISDIDVLKIAKTQNRILITLDKDFGELVFKEKLVHSGVILIRFRSSSLDDKKKFVKTVLKSKKNYHNKFSVIRQKSDKTIDK